MADILDNGSDWWSSYNKRRATILENKTSLNAIKSIQNFYESFCRIPTESHLDVEEVVNNILQEDSKEYDEDDLIVNIEEDDVFLNLTSEDTRNVKDNFLQDPFVSKLASLAQAQLQKT